MFVKVRIKPITSNFPLPCCWVEKGSAKKSEKKWRLGWANVLGRAINSPYLHQKKESTASPGVPLAAEAKFRQTAGGADGLGRDNDMRGR